MFSIGAVLGGLTTGALLSFFNALIPPGLGYLPGLIAGVAVLALSLSQAFGWHDYRLPHRPQIVPQEQVLGKEPLQGALQFGYEMGTGMRTHMPSNLPYLALAAGLLLSPWWGGLLAGLGFAAGRVAMSVGRWSDTEWEGLWQVNERTVLITLNLAGALVFAVILWPAFVG